MTRQPWTIRNDAELSTARDMMREHGIRHLPVLEGGRLVGVISERDIQILRSLVLEETAVEDAMEAQVFTVLPEDELATVIEQMAAKKIGSVVVIDQRGHVEGIFTTIDALTAFAETLRRETA